tara:strand:+ start:10260 stop:10448 length:189 start_codon:yes stop_codon:yes gene_type:complete
MHSLGIVAIDFTRHPFVVGYRTTMSVMKSILTYIDHRSSAVLEKPGNTKVKDEDAVSFTTGE